MRTNTLARLTRTALILAAVSGTVSNVLAQESPERNITSKPIEPPAMHVDAPADAARPVDLVICLDSSGSMDGLIDAARQRLWAIVNDLATAKPQPALRVALLSYGNDGYSAEGGWVKVLSPLTTDLDAVSRELFGLSTNGGTEYVGRVVEDAVTQLEWSKGPGLRLIVVAGNESADQDQQVKFQKACGDAIAKGIMVNAIYCGNDGDSDAAGWRQVAKLADGEYLAINQNDNQVIPTPYDARLTELSTELNKTYVPLGAGGRAGQSNQQAQDMNVAAAPGASAARAVTKAGSMYQNSWDLLDRLESKDAKQRIELKDVKDDDLPEKMRKMTQEERAAYVETLRGKREEIQKQIAEEGAKRADFLAKEQAKRAAEAGKKNFEGAMTKAVREQARKQGFQWEK